MSQSPSSNRARFGPYELDFEAHALRKNGTPIRLQEQPWQVLCALVEKPGAVVTREELQKRLWPEGTFVDFDQSLNKAVNKLREALNDSADRPHYIETLARQGYRFVAAVEGEATLQQAAPTPQPPVKAKGRALVRIAALAVALVLILATGLWPTPQPVVQVTALTRDARVRLTPIVVSGGRVIYSVSGLGKISNRGELWSIPADGGTARMEPTPCAQTGYGTDLLGFSNLHKRLLLRCVPVAFEADLWLTGVDGSSPKWISHVNLADHHEESISPGLETLLFSRKEGLFANPMDGSGERLLVRRMYGISSRTLFGIQGEAGSVSFE